MDQILEVLPSNCGVGQASRLCLGVSFFLVVDLKKSMPYGHVFFTARCKRSEKVHVLGESCEPLGVEQV